MRSRKGAREQAREIRTKTWGEGSWEGGGDYLCLRDIRSRSTAVLSSITHRTLRISMLLGKLRKRGDKSASLETPSWNMPPGKKWSALEICR